MKSVQETPQPHDAWVPDRCFRDWAAARSEFPAEVAEMALAHVVGDKVEAAYRRGDMFEKRQQIMEAWSGFCSTNS